MILQMKYLMLKRSLHQVQLKKEEKRRLYTSFKG